jgi:ADP-ribose pyrophosphatase YjhB (NUDIX family)
MQALAQSGLTYARDPYDIERYEALRALAAEVVATHAGMPRDVIHGLFATDVGYATPKLDVRGVVFRDDGALLLVRERSDGGWTLPGGWVDVGESPSEAVEKEVREESGYVVRATKVLALLDRDRHGHPPHPFHTWKVFIRCALVGGAAATEGLETDGVGFFRADTIPPLSLTRVVPAQIARLFEHYAHPDWAADFD